MTAGSPSVHDSTRRPDQVDASSAAARARAASRAASRTCRPAAAKAAAIVGAVRPLPTTVALSRIMRAVWRARLDLGRQCPGPLERLAVIDGGPVAADRPI